MECSTDKPDDLLQIKEDRIIGYLCCQASALWKKGPT